MREQTGSEEWMTKAEIAAHLKCTPRYINTLMRRGILPYLKTRGLLRFNPEDCSLALTRFKTRSRYGLDGRATEPTVPIIYSAKLALPAAISKCPTSEEQPNASVATQSICAKAFDSPEKAKRYLDEMIQPAVENTRLHNQAPITVIILQSAPGT